MTDEHSKVTPEPVGRGTAESSALGLLRISAFRYLVFGRTISLLGNAMAPVALAFAVLDLTGSVTDLGLVVAARSVANVALLLFGGVLADRLPRSVLLAGSSAAGAVTQAVIAVLVLTGHPAIVTLMILSAANGAAAALAIPASTALTPDTVPAAALHRANALLRLGINGAAVLGASVGGVVVALAGPGWALLIDAAAYAAAGVLFTRIVLPPREPSLLQSSVSVPADSRRPSMLSDLRTGWTEFRSRQWVWVVVAQFTIVNAAFVGAIGVLGPVVADLTFGRGGYGVVQAALTVGLVLGAAVAIRWTPRYPLRVGVGLVALTALPAFALGVSPHLLLVAAAALIAGVAFEVFGVGWNVALQQHVPREMLARVASYDALGSFVAIPVGEAAVGPLAQVWGTDAVLMGCGVAIVLASAAALVSGQVRSLQRVTDAAELGH